MMLAIGMPGPWELAIIVIVIVTLFGAKKIPELARSLGKAKGEFQKGLKEGAAAEASKPDEPQA